MKTKWHLYMLWSVLSLGLLSAAGDTYEASLTGRKKVFRLGTPKSKPTRLSTAGGRKSLQRLPPSAPPSARPGLREAGIKSGLAYLPDVSVTCSTSDFVVRVKPSFYGLGADAEELKLGNTCKSNGVLGPYGDLLFTYPLTACDAVRQSPGGYLVYKYVLHYEPSPKRFPSRAQRVDVDIECRYDRNYHVYQLTVQPTWQTAIMRKRLKGNLNDFQIELLDDSWSRPVKSQVYQLGKTVNLQVSAPHLPPGGKLYIRSCYATPSSGSSLKYTIIDNFGCMLDSKRDPGASQFISRTDKNLRFSLKAFQFTFDPDTEVIIHCKLFVTSEEPGPAHKSCTYRGNRWKALTGDDSICECCDSQCVTPKPRRAMMEGSASSGSLLVSDQPYTEEEEESGFLPVSSSSVGMSRDGDTSISHRTGEQQGHEKLWRSADVVIYDDEEQSYTDLEEFSFREENESEVRDSNLFEEDGSGYLVEEEEGLEGSEGGISDVQQVIGLNQEEVSEIPSGNRRGEEDNRMMKNYENDVVDGEMTWYFSWR